MSVSVLGNVGSERVWRLAVGSAQITALDVLTVARAVNALGEAGYEAKASEVSAGTAAQAVPGASCCGGAKKDAARGRCCG